MQEFGRKTVRVALAIGAAIWFISAPTEAAQLAGLGIDLGRQTIDAVGVFIRTVAGSIG